MLARGEGKGWECLPWGNPRDWVGICFTLPMPSLWPFWWEMPSVGAPRMSLRLQVQKLWPLQQEFSVGLSSSNRKFEVRKVLLLFPLKVIIDECTFQCPLKKKKKKSRVRSHLPSIVIYLIQVWLSALPNGFISHFTVCSRTMTKCCFWGWSLLWLCSFCPRLGKRDPVVTLPGQTRRPTRHTHIYRRLSPQPKPSEPSQNS